MRLTVIFLSICFMTSADAASFDCSKAGSLTENLICHTTQLSLQDEELGRAYKAARAEVKTWNDTYANGLSASQWFLDHSRKSFRWREDNCYDVACLVRWYRERTALMKWITHENVTDRLGDLGLEYLGILPNGDVALSYGMMTHTRNVVYRWKTGEFESLSNGYLTVTNDPIAPIDLRGHIGYFKGGGRYSVDIKMDGYGNYYWMGVQNDGSRCMSRKEFITSTAFYSEDLFYIPGDNFCVWE